MMYFPALPIALTFSETHVKGVTYFTLSVEGLRLVTVPKRACFGLFRVPVLYAIEPGLYRSWPFAV